MFGRPHFGSPQPRTTTTERYSNDASGPGAIDAWSDDRGADPDAERADDRLGGPRHFDPIWGTLGAPLGHGDGGWPAANQEQTEGAVADVELLGDGLHLAGKIDLGQFDRLSGWLNMQSGFIQLRDARQVDPIPAARGDMQDGPLWVRLNQIVVVADLSAVRLIRSGVAIVEKERRRVCILTRSFGLVGNIHIHAHGQIAQFLEATDPRFLPITELTVRRLSGSGAPVRFASAMVNREQLVTFLEVSELAESGVDRQEVRSA